MVSQTEAPTRRYWLPEEVTHLKSHYLTRTAEEIAAELNRTPCMVYKKAQQLGLEKARRWRTSDLKQVVQIIEQNDLDPETRKSYRDIAGMVNRSKSSVNALVQRYGLKKPAIEGI